jgi:hypothetical protein
MTPAERGALGTLVQNVPGLNGRDGHGRIPVIDIIRAGGRLVGNGEFQSPPYQAAYDLSKLTTRHPSRGRCGGSLRVEIRAAAGVRDAMITRLLNAG